DVERRRRRRLQREAQRGAPFRELAGHPFEVARVEVAGVDELQDQGLQVFLLDGRGLGARRQREGMALELPRQREREERVQLAPLGGNPLLEAVEARAGVEREVVDLA